MLPILSSIAVTRTSRRMPPAVQAASTRRTIRSWPGASGWHAPAGATAAPMPRRDIRALHRDKPVAPACGRIWPPAAVDIEATTRQFTALPVPSPLLRTTRLPEIMPRIEALLLSMTSRGIDKIGRREGAGNLLTALHALQRANRVLLCTGFNVAPGMPETDGPVGTAILAYALWRIGKTPVIVADESNSALMRVAMHALDARFAAEVQIEALPGSHADRTEQAHQMLKRIGPDVVMHIEVPGRNGSGVYSNMVGVAIDDFNKPHDELMNVANREGIATIGVGDGGNEAGMGGALNVPAAINGNEMQAVVPAQHQIFAWNSNLGAIAPAELLIALNDCSPQKHHACTGVQLVDIIRSLLEAGAVDGVTRSSQFDAEGVDRKGQPAHTAVDGHPSSRHVDDLEALHGIIDTLRMLNRIDAGATSC
jgi:hypothetical protein